MHRLHSEETSSVRPHLVRPKPMTTALDVTNSPELVTTLEEAALNGLPALQTEFYDGWIVRMAEGYSRRANCVESRCMNPQPRSRRSWFIVKRRMRGHRYLAFSRFFRPVNLGIWTRPWHSFSNLETPIHWFKPCGLRPVPLVPLPYRYTSQHSEVFRSLLNAIPTPSAYVIARTDGQSVGCARAVVSGSIMGLFDLIVDSEHRGQGFGRGLLEARLKWGFEQGAVWHTCR